MIVSYNFMDLLFLANFSVTRFTRTYGTRCSIIRIMKFSVIKIHPPMIHDIICILFVIFIITILSVYIMAQREGFGWEAALFTCLIPTTIGILGPAFTVPVAMGLLFTPLLIFLAFNFRTVWSYLVIFILAKQQNIHF